MERYGYSAIRGRPGMRASPRARSASGIARTLALALAAATALTAAGCAAAAGAAKKSGTVQLIDEAFAALFPDAWARLGGLPEAAPLRIGPAPKGAADSPAAPIALQGIGPAVDRFLARLPQKGAAGGEKAQAAAGAIIASPLAAERLLAAAGEAGAAPPPLVVPFASGFGLAGGVVHEVRYDYQAAYAAMGRRAAAAVKKLPAKDGTRPVCGIVFQENFMRGSEALAAFSSAFSAACGREPIVVNLDARSAVDPTGAARAAVAELMGEAGVGSGVGTPLPGPPSGLPGPPSVQPSQPQPPPAAPRPAPARPSPAEQPAASPAPGHPPVGVLVLAIDNAAVADEAAKKAKSIEVLADASSWGERAPDARFYRAAIGGDEAGLAGAAMELARRLASGRGAPASTVVQLRFKTFFPRIF